MAMQESKSKQIGNITSGGEAIHRKVVATCCAVLGISFAAYFLLFGYLFDIDSPLIGGPKRLLIEDNVGRLSITRAFDSLELFFDDEFSLGNGHQVVRIKDGIDRLLAPAEYEVRQSSNRKGLTVQLKNRDSSVGEMRLFIRFKGSTQGDFPTKKFINTIVLDRQEVSLTSFYQHFLNLKQSNVLYYKSFTIQNISNYLARTSGMQLLVAVTAILIFLLAGQVIVFFLTVMEHLLSKDTLQFGKHARIPINWLDIVSEDYSTFLGFLGTALSLWLALEQSSMDFSNFFQLLELIKYAVFTTVLGLLIRTIYGIRKFIYDISAKEKGSDQ